jgi:PIN domain nuclease of toxin-antitoxin system
MVLLDTCAFIWLADRNNRFSDAAVKTVTRKS